MPNPKSANILLAKMFKKHFKELLNNSNRVENTIEKMMLGMRAEILRKIRSGKRNDLGVILQQVEEIINGSFAKAGQEIVSKSKEFYLSASEFVTTSINGTVGASITVSILNVQLVEEAVSKAAIKNKLMASFWKKQQEVMVNGFRKEFMKGLLEGETMNQLTKRLEENTNLNLAKNNMRSIARTTLSTVTDNAHMDTYQKNSDVVGYIESVAVLDSRTTFISMAYNGSTWSLPNLVPFGPKSMPYAPLALHWRERDRRIPGLRSYMDLPEEKKKLIPLEKRASMDGLVTKPVDFDEFLKKRSDAELQKMLGKTGSELWKSGKITTTDLIDSTTGTPLTQRQLKQKYDS